MPTTLGRNLHLCFSIIKRPQSISDQHHHRPNPTATSSPPSTTSSSSPSVLIKNFNSLYDYTTTTFDDSATTSNDSEHDAGDISASTPDLAAVFASQRFFFSTPGRSNSIIDSAENAAQLRDSVAVPTYSPDPYADFRRSMQEMVDARVGGEDVKSDWEYLHELLLCYLALNPKSTHKFIIGAFSDLLVSLMPPPPVNRRAA